MTWKTFNGGCRVGDKANPVMDEPGLYPQSNILLEPKRSLHQNLTLSKYRSAMPRTLWREFMDGPILLWSLWPCLSPSVPLFIKARRACRFRFSTIHHLISVIIFLSVNHLEVIYFDSQHVPCNFPPSLAAAEKPELLVHNCRSVSATVDLHTVSVRPTAFWLRLRNKKCFIARTSSNTPQLEVFAGILRNKHLWLSAR